MKTALKTLALSSAILVPLTVAAMTQSPSAPLIDGAPQGWKNLKSSYDTCKKTDGVLPEFFNSVDISIDGDVITFAANTAEHGVIASTYKVDGIVRRGSDYHYQADGTVLPDLPSHEAAFWEKNELVREEVTYLPDGGYAMESNTLSVDADGALNYSLIIGGNTLLQATCR